MAVGPRWQTVLNYLGLGPASSSGRTSRDESTDRFDRLERRRDELDARLDSITPDDTPERSTGTLDR